MYFVTRIIIQGEIEKSETGTTSEASYHYLVNMRPFVSKHVTPALETVQTRT